MSPTPAASLHTGLLAAKGSAQPSRGLAQPLHERIAGGGANAGTLLRSLATEKNTRTIAAAPRRIAILLDERQRLRLRLASAHLGKSRQAILIHALDHYLTEVVPALLNGPCSCIGAARNEPEPCCQGQP